MDPQAAKPSDLPAACGSRIPTGHPVLDELLGGGLSRGVACLLMGPPYSGKELVAAGYAHASALSGEPLVVCLTSMFPGEFRALVSTFGPHFAAHEAKGHVAYVDGYGSLLGDDATDPLAVRVKDPSDPGSLLEAMDAARKRLGEPPAFRLLVLGLTDLALRAGSRAAEDGHAWLQRCLALARRWGATAVLSMDSDVHGQRELGLFLRLTQGAIEFRESEDARTFLRVRGLEGPATRDWIEYRLRGGSLEIVGGLLERKIR